MDQIKFTPRPEKSASALDGMYTLFIAWFAAGAVFIAVALRAHDSRFAMVFAGFGFVMIGFMALALGWIYFSELRDRRRYPERLQEYLQRPLLPGDYEQIERIARRHPEVKPWIQEVMDGDGQLRYREAEQLQARINDHLAALPQQQLAATLRQP